MKGCHIDWSEVGHLARAMRERGLPVLPVVGKEPEGIAGWQRKYGLLQPWSEIDADAKRISATGFGLVMGCVVGASHALVCIDAETAKIAAEIAAETPQTLRISSPSGGVKFVFAVTGDVDVLDTIPGSLTGGRVELLWTSKQVVAGGLYPGKPDQGIPSGYYEAQGAIGELDAEFAMDLVRAYVLDTKTIVLNAKKNEKATKARRAKKTTASKERGPVTLAAAEVQVSIVEQLQASVGLNDFFLPLLYAARKGELAGLFAFYDDWHRRACELENKYGPKNGEIIARELSRLCGNYDDSAFDRLWASILDADEYEVCRGKRARRKASLARVLYEISPELRGHGAAARMAYARKSSDMARIKGAQACAYRAREQFDTWADEAQKSGHDDGCYRWLVERIRARVVEGRGVSNIGTIAEMAREIGKSPAAISKCLARMSAAGLIARTRGNAMGGEILVCIPVKISQKIMPQKPFCPGSLRLGWVVWGGRMRPIVISTSTTRRSIDWPNLIRGFTNPLSVYAQASRG